MEIRKCEKCNEPIPEIRIFALPNTTTCVNCSSEKPYRAATVIHNKTTRTIEIYRDNDTRADEMQRMTRRGFHAQLPFSRGK